MTPHRRIAVIGNSLPRRCGIATFTTDLVRAIASSRPNVETCIVAMNDHGQTYDYPGSVAFQIKDDAIEDYVRAAAFLNAGRFDLVCLQHEFGIFGGEAGSHILELLSRLNMPVITTLHTVLAKPGAAQRAVMERLVEASSKIVVMANKGREMLRSVYGVADDKIEVIAHGIPEFPFVEPDPAKAKLGFSDRAVILTFGLLSPSKGIEVMIDAMPSILQRRADAVYVVLGATHPNLVRDQGEAYRESLMTRVRELGVENHVVFLDQFVDRVSKLKVGDPRNPETELGPLINQRQAQTFAKQVQRGIDEGAKAVLHGTVEGTLASPTVFADVKSSMWVAQNEMFGPAVCVMPFDTEEEALRIANDSPYGLSGAIHTQDAERGAELAKQFDSGMVHVNDGTINDDPLIAFGGEKASGVGRLNGKWALEEFTTMKWISVQHKRRHYPFEIVAKAS